MNNRQRNRRTSRLRQSPDWPPSRRRRAAGRTEGTTPATPPTEAPDTSSSGTA
ncbi:hypothetical protein AB0E75_24745 [Streptomyces griseoviridis]|uniref:Uncharacterized protein n=1 Tax=Streptomyces griseoviridis TaxID=45398 RepID=A0A918GW72_STRGD|nr:hypothetical protein [Streptomyces niveoruber]GGS64098.1 hypothetical protein GCM10010238_61450 [Streptomyces niveoruber]